MLNSLNDQKSFRKGETNELLNFSKLANLGSFCWSIIFNASVYESSAFHAEHKGKNPPSLRIPHLIITDQTFSKNTEFS